MNSVLSPEPISQSTVFGDQFLVSFGKSAAVGVFRAGHDWPLRRGDAVVVRTARGVERGSVLSPATLRQSRLLGSTVSGDLLRPWSEQDERTLVDLRAQAATLFDRSRTMIREIGIGIVPLDLDYLLDAPCVILQFVGEADDARLLELATRLRAEFAFEIRLENLSLPKETAPHDHGCGKPDCGKTEGGGCSTCSTGGGCSSCGTEPVDLRPYFAHLRSEMEQKRRPLN